MLASCSSHAHKYTHTHTHTHTHSHTRTPVLCHAGQVADANSGSRQAAGVRRHATSNVRRGRHAWCVCFECVKCVAFGPTCVCTTDLYGSLACGCGAVNACFCTVLYRGLGTTLVRAVPANFAIFGLYETTMRLLG